MVKVSRIYNHQGIKEESICLIATIKVPDVENKIRGDFMKFSHFKEVLRCSLCARLSK